MNQTKHDRTAALILYLSVFLSIIFPVQMILALPLYLFSPPRSVLRRIAFRSSIIGLVQYFAYAQLTNTFMNISGLSNPGDVSPTVELLRELPGSLLANYALVMGAVYVLSIAISMFQLRFEWTWKPDSSIS